MSYVFIIGHKPCDGEGGGDGMIDGDGDGDGVMAMAMVITCEMDFFCKSSSCFFNSSICVLKEMAFLTSPLRGFFATTVSFLIIVGVVFFLVAGLKFLRNNNNNNTHNW